MIICRWCQKLKEHLFRVYEDKEVFHDLCLDCAMALEQENTCNNEEEQI